VPFQSRFRKPLVACAIAAAVGTGAEALTAFASDATARPALAASQNGSDAPAATTPIQHVVIIYQENHSFDNVMSQFCAQNPGRQCTGPTIGDSVTLADGTNVTVGSEPDIVPVVNHDPGAQTRAAANRWDTIGGCTTTAHYGCIAAVPGSQVPNLYAAAKTGAIATNMFQATDHESWPAHFELVAATADGFTGFNPRGTSGCRGKGLAPWQSAPGAKAQQVPACIPTYGLSPKAFPLGWPNNAGGAFEATPVAHVPNILEDRLDPAGLTWKEYINSGIKNTSIWTICADFASCIYTSDATNVVSSKYLAIDAAAGKLSNVSIVLPNGPVGATSQHNGTSMTVGDNQIGTYLHALSNGPEWSSTAVFILYDDCGCFYDHVTPPPGDGPRTPLILASPWAAHGTTYSAQTTTASLLAFIETNWGLQPLSTWDAQADPLTGMFDFTQTPALAPLHTVKRPVPTNSTTYLRRHPPSKIVDNT
jgi:phospholipase C